jgi:hypothetical protein
MLLLTTYLPLITNNLPTFIGSFHFYAIIFCVSIILFQTNVVQRKTILITLIIGVVLVFVFPNIFWLYLDEWNRENQFFDFYYIFIAILIFSFYEYTGDKVSCAKMVQIALLFLGITAIMTLYSAYLNPMYARYLAGSFFEKDEGDFFQRLGGGTYSTATAIMALIPMLFYYFKNNILLGRKKYFIFLYASLLFISLIRMQIFGNILIAVVIMIFSLRGSKNINMSILYVVVIVVIPMRSL